MRLMLRRKLAEPKPNVVNDKQGEHLRIALTIFDEDGLYKEVEDVVFFAPEVDTPRSLINRVLAANKLPETTQVFQVDYERVSLVRQHKITRWGKP